MQEKMLEVGQLAMFTLFLLIIAGCSQKELTVAIVANRPTEIGIAPGEVVLLEARVPTGVTGPVTYQWSATKGNLSTTDSPMVEFTAPDEVGDVAVSVEVSAGDLYSSSSIRFQVLQLTVTSTSAPTHTPIATSTETVIPTNTPIPTPTPTVTPTRTPTSTSTSTPTSTPPAPTPTPDPAVYCTDSGDGGTVPIRLEPPRTIARIRISVTEKATEWGCSLWEVEIRSPVAGNVAIGATPIASTSQNSEGCWGCSPELAIDGNVETRWSSDWKDESPWLEITLPTALVVDRVVLYWEDAYAESYCVEVFE